MLLAKRCNLSAIPLDWKRDYHQTWSNLPSVGLRSPKARARGDHLQRRDTADL
jgi:hypothetical protein